MTTLRRTAGATLGTLLCLTLAPQAQAAPSYAGNFTGTSDSAFEFSLDKHSGKLYFDQYRWGQVESQCEGGSESIGRQGGFDPPDGRLRHRAFRIRQSAPANNYLVLIEGELRPGGIAKGVIRMKYESSQPGLGVCDTGKLEWKAQKL